MNSYKIAAKLAVGYKLDELINDITKSTPASFEPTIDYIVTKIPKFTFEKFPGTKKHLTTSMKSVGEVMSIGRSFQESLQKALRSLENGLNGIDNFNLNLFKKNVEDLEVLLAKPTPERLLIIGEAFRKNIPLERIQEITFWDPWFLEQINGIIKVENHIEKYGLIDDKNFLQNIKAMGFSDNKIAYLSKKPLKQIVNLRKKHNIFPVFKRVDTCSAEFFSETAYLYSTYETSNLSECESKPSNKKKVIILGGGPNRIGQGIEFDYCCVHASYTLSEQKIETIMINCNPETVSTDYDTSDKLYFEPLTIEDVLEIVNKEKQNGNLVGVIVQLGGQTPLKIASGLENQGVKILGTSVDAIDLAEDRKRFQSLIKKLKLKQPQNDVATSKKEAMKICLKIGFPIVIRPSYVLGGRAMEIVHNFDQLDKYITEAVNVSGKSPVLIDKFLKNAKEIDVDAIGDSENVYIAGIMEHIEEAGIHSGDSACVLPPQTISKQMETEIIRQTKIIAKELNVKGFMNIQFAIKDNELYILEVNPRGSRTIPFVAKSTGLPLVKMAAQIMVGKKLKAFGIKNKQHNHVSVKEAVFPFARFPGTDIILGPEMKSTGEVMGIGENFEIAFYKSQIGANVSLPDSGNVFISVKNEDKSEIILFSKILLELGFKIIATSGTSKTLEENNIPSKKIKKVYEGRPNIVDLMLSGEINLVINTVEGVKSIEDSFSLRQTALLNNIPYYTTIQGANAVILAIKNAINKKMSVKSLQSYFS